jgi:hypothetical protein
VFSYPAYLSLNTPRRGGFFFVMSRLLLYRRRIIHGTKLGHIIHLWYCSCFSGKAYQRVLINYTSLLFLRLVGVSAPGLLSERKTHVDTNFSSQPMGRCNSIASSFYDIYIIAHGCWTSHLRIILSTSSSPRCMYHTAATNGRCEEFES